MLRIGINLGDIILQGEDVNGDGVSIAARLKLPTRAGRSICTLPISICRRRARQPAAAASAPISSRRMQAATCGCVSAAATATGSSAGTACRQASIA